MSVGRWDAGQDGGGGAKFPFPRSNEASCRRRGQKVCGAVLQHLLGAGEVYVVLQQAVGDGSGAEVVEVPCGVVWKKSVSVGRVSCDGNGKIVAAGTERATIDSASRTGGKRAKVVAAFSIFVRSLVDLLSESDEGKA